MCPHDDVSSDVSIHLCENSVIKISRLLHLFISLCSSGSNWKGSSKCLSQSQTSLNHTVEKLELDDLTTTETAKLLRKQFAKLKVKANNLKVKDNELKQRFVLLQNQRGRVCGHGGSVTKSKLRASPVLF